MIDERFERFAMLVGRENVEYLSERKVLVFGVGGVGGYVCEALARSGIGRVDVVDNDEVSLTNINRQIIALDDTLGISKVDVIKKRLESINPKIKVTSINMFFTPENSEKIDFSKYDYVVDAIDTVTAKLEIVKRAKDANVPVISSMGTGNKLDPTKLVVTDIYKTKICPLARVMRSLCRKNNIESLKVVYSEEEAITPVFQPEDNNNPNKSVPASSAFVPSSAGLLIASCVVRDLCGIN